MTKPKIPSIVLSEKENRRKIEGGQKRTMKKMETTRGRGMAMVYYLNSVKEPNGDFGSVVYYYNINKGNKYHIPRGKGQKK